MILVTCMSKVHCGVKPLQCEVKETRPVYHQSAEEAKELHQLRGNYSNFEVLPICIPLLVVRKDSSHPNCTRHKLHERTLAFIGFMSHGT